MDHALIIRNFITAIWNNQDFSSIPLFVGPAYRIDLDRGDPWEGKPLDHGEFEKRLHYSFDSFPDMHFDILSTLSDGDLVAITWSMTGTNQGKIGDFPPTFQKIQTSGVTIYRVCNGLVCGHSQVFDRTTVMRQLGFLAQ